MHETCSFLHCVGMGRCVMLAVRRLLDGWLMCMRITTGISKRKRQVREGAHFLQFMMKDYNPIKDEITSLKGHHYHQREKREKKLPAVLQGLSIISNVVICSEKVQNVLARKEGTTSLPRRSCSLLLLTTSLIHHHDSHHTSA